MANTGKSKTRAKGHKTQEPLTTLKRSKRLQSNPAIPADPRKGPAKSLSTRRVPPKVGQEVAGKKLGTGKRRAPLGGRPGTFSHFPGSWQGFAPRPPGNSQGAVAMWGNGFPPGFLGASRFSLVFTFCPVLRGCPHPKRWTRHFSPVSPPDTTHGLDNRGGRGNPIKPDPGSDVTCGRPWSSVVPFGRSRCLSAPK